MGVIPSLVATVLRPAVGLVRSIKPGDQPTADEQLLYEYASEGDCELSDSIVELIEEVVEA